MGDGPCGARGTSVLWRDGVVCLGGGEVMSQLDLQFHNLKSPFPYFGGKSRVAPVVWKAFGKVRNYCEPFAGSLAMLLKNPHWQECIETVNELNPYIANFWRATQADPEAVAFHCDWPVNETDLHARHLWLIQQNDFREHMTVDPDYFDAKIAGWWVWGISCWIGHGWCDTTGLNAKKDGTPWRRPLALSSAGQGINRTTRQIPELSPARGVRGIANSTLPTRQMRHLSGRQGVTAVPQKMPNVKGTGGGHRQSLNEPETFHLDRKRPSIAGHKEIDRLTRQLPFVGNAGRGVAAPSRRDALIQYFGVLSERLRSVRVVCGDWGRVMGYSVLDGCASPCAVFLDPPYDTGHHLYGEHNNKVAKQVLDWCLALDERIGKTNWENPNLRIALCGYEGELDIPSDWRVIEWKGAKGYANAANKNRERERIWLSPACMEIESPKEKQLNLFNFEVA